MHKDEFITSFVLNYMSVWCAEQKKDKSYVGFSKDIDTQTYLAMEMARKCWDTLQKML